MALFPERRDAVIEALTDMLLCRSADMSRQVVLATMSVELRAYVREYTRPDANGVLAYGGRLDYKVLHDSIVQHHADHPPREDDLFNALCVVRANAHPPC
jgi:hypothetical protein